ncbi:protein brunelleschi [Anthonomus grandis grandis]|uniref:protein brunelleschi n=1 Tax=Anthonomus grandis grandis TaxID=2921223 RepID=UPI0021651352|nr:protein brunelleschi [Anthonomus grandis grandis]
MRSSVSYILSTSVNEPNMSHPDYDQISHDHAALLVLVKHIGAQLKPKTFSKFYDRIAKLSQVKITDSSGQVRTIFVRYIKEHPVENSDWGDFQTHRRLIGLISLGKYDSQTELNEVCRVHESLKVKYNNTLYDSRSILFGPTKEVESPTSPIDKSSSSEESEAIKSEVNVEKFTTPSNFKTRALFYDENSPCADLENQIVEFINSLFWVLESKRQDRSREKLERVSSLLLAPFEKKDFVGLDMESRQNKKRCTGRMTKHLGDLCLQAGLVAESLQYYTTAAETLKSVNDWLWLGAAYEGLCTASALVLYPNMQRTENFQRIGSLPEGSPKKPTQETQSSNIPVKKTVPNVLAPDEICKRYREAIIHFSKYQNAGIVETEASFKAARIAVEQNHALQAAGFLQNVVYINLALSEQEKIQRFENLAQLYTQIGFNRKAAFCLRLAATRYVSSQNPNPNWNKCYSLMLQSLPGHKLILDPVEMIEADQGWPTLQIQILQDLVVAAKRAGHSALATRHMTFLLQTMWPHLSSTEQKELAIQLQSLSVQCEGSPVPLVLESGVVVPPANLTDIPKCCGFILNDLNPHLRPRVIKKEKEDTGPFLFTPIHFGSLDRKTRDKADPKMEFLWVENEVCEVSLKLVNPLPFELKVSNMRLLTSGVVFESAPETVTLLPDMVTSLTLSGWARESGELEITGYSTHALGVKSNCRLKYMSGNFPPQYKIDVIPSLPILQVSTSLPQSASFSNFHDDSIVTSASLSLFHGESSQCTITLNNTSQIPVEMLEVTVNSILDQSLQNEIFFIDQEQVNLILPLLPGQTASFEVKIYAAANFLAPNMPVSPSIPPDLNSGMFSSLSNSLPGNSSFSRVTSSFRSSNSGQSSLAGGLSALFQQPPMTSSVEAQLKIRYSGGPGLQSEHCRTSTVFFMVELIPSLHVTNWDVLPAEKNSQFYLVLDVANLTNQEMELEYTTNKHMLIEGQESCRVPVPVNRCPLSKLSDFYEEPDKSKNLTNINRICSEHIADLVKLKWMLNATDSVGIASLKGITLNSRMLDIVRMSPLEWDVKINGDPFRAQEDISCEAGDCMELQMSIANSLDASLKELTLSVQFYQDYNNGTLNYRMDTRLAISGASKKILSSLEPKNVASHKCNVVFFTPGLYKVDIQCYTPDSSNSSTAPLVSTGHIWRFTPPIAIQVR